MYICTLVCQSVITRGAKILKIYCNAAHPFHQMCVTIYISNCNSCELMQHAWILSHFYLKILRFKHPGSLTLSFFIDSLPPFKKKKKEIKLNYKLNYKTITIIYKSYERSIWALVPIRIFSDSGHNPLQLIAIVQTLISLHNCCGQTDQHFPYKCCWTLKTNSSGGPKLSSTPQKKIWKHKW